MAIANAKKAEITPRTPVKKVCTLMYSPTFSAGANFVVHKLHPE
ncbi:hypothetical protein [Rubritalea tangerina]